jgi:heat shock protein HslJ
MTATRRRSPLVLGLAAVVLVVLAACGPSIGTPSPTTSPPGGAPTASPPGASLAPSPDPSAEGNGAGIVGGLVGTGWRVLRVDDVAPVPGSEPTIAFKDGRIEGHTGCNSYGGSATIEGTAFEAGDLAMTLIGCLDGIGDMETAFLRALHGADELAVQGANLLIRGDGGQILLRPDATIR